MTNKPNQTVLDDTELIVIIFCSKKFNCIFAPSASTGVGSSPSHMSTYSLAQQLDDRSIAIVKDEINSLYTLKYVSWTMCK